MPTIPCHWALLGLHTSMNLRLRRDFKQQLFFKRYVHVAWVTSFFSLFKLFSRVNWHLLGYYWTLAHFFVLIIPFWGCGSPSHNKNFVYLSFASSMLANCQPLIWLLHRPNPSWQRTQLTKLMGRTEYSEEFCRRISTIKWQSYLKHKLSSLIFGKCKQIQFLNLSLFHGCPKPKE